VIATSSVSPSATCTQEYAALTDVATARDFAKGQNDKLVAAYFGDTAGQLWRYTLAGGLSLAYNFTCNQPLHFSPTVVQLDRDSVASSHAHEIYLVQVTNSNLDLDTVSLPASQMIFAKELAQADSNGNITGCRQGHHLGHGWPDRAHHGHQPDLRRDPCGNRRHRGLRHAAARPPRGPPRRRSAY
jgi:hypothetical protein